MDIPINNILGEYAFFVGDIKYEYNTVYSFQDIMLLDNLPFLNTEESAPVFMAYDDDSDDTLYQYGHTFSRQFKCFKASIKDSSHISVIISKAFDQLENNPGGSIMLMQTVMYLLSLYSSVEPTKITNKTNRVGVKPYDL